MASARMAAVLFIVFSLVFAVSAPADDDAGENDSSVETSEAVQPGEAPEYAAKYLNQYEYVKENPSEAADVPLAQKMSEFSPGFMRREPSEASPEFHFDESGYPE